METVCTSIAEVRGGRKKTTLNILMTFAPPQKKKMGGGGGAVLVSSRLHDPGMTRIVTEGSDGAATAVAVKVAVG